MATKADRLIKLLNLLDQGASVTVKALCEEWGVDKRTVFRYMNTLQEGNFPVYFDSEKNTYTFANGFTLKKASLDVDEMLALAMARKMLIPLGKTLEDAFDRLEEKIAGSTNSKGGFAPSSAFILPFPTALPTADMSALLKDLATAITEHQLVQIDYKGLQSQEVTRREVEPYYLFFSPDGFWNLRAYCRLRNDRRVFALDQVQGWKVLDRYFIPKFFAEDPGMEFSAGFGTFMDGETEEVVVQFSPDIRPFVERRLWHPSQQNKELDEGWLEVRFTTSGVAGLKYWLYRWTPHFKVVSPVRLRQEMMEDLLKEVGNLQFL
ncbi:MAG: helix-turn-helix transcriptional regulator [Syntrophobacteraceae bacterium]